MAEEDDTPPKRKVRLALEAKNTIPKEKGELSTYVANALSMQVPPHLFKSPKKSVSRLLPHYDVVLLVVQSTAIGQVYKSELDSCESHTVSLIAGKASKVQHQAAALAGAGKVVAIGSPAALRTAIEMGVLAVAGRRTVVAIDGRTNAKGYNLFMLKTEQSPLKSLLEAAVQSQATVKSLVLNRNAPPLPQPTD